MQQEPLGSNVLLSDAQTVTAAELAAVQSNEPTLHVDDLCLVAANYLTTEQVEEIRRAYFFAEKAHGDQKRRSGAPYITHPLAVAHVLAMMHMDHECIMAGLMHDVIEDTAETHESLAAQFSEEIAAMVDGVTKLDKVAEDTQQQAQAENLRKMLLAMTQDIRVIIVKLADRLHNMRTLGVLAAEKRRRIAQETLDIYVPIAQRLGMNLMRSELEDLGFHMRYPLRYRALEKAVKKASGNRKEIVNQVIESMTVRMEQEGVKGTVQGRQKYLYSIYRKMQDKSLSFSELMDVHAFRITLDDVDACYRALGVVHNLYKPVQGQFKDYIAIPKANGYQSLHTFLVGPHGLQIEVQIRSKEMDQMAEAGVAAHWLYKTGAEGNNQAHQRARQWLQGLLEMQKGAGDSVEFLENLRIDLFPDEIYVFTPKGKIMSLPRGATPVDLAYAVHSDLGKTCVAAKVDRKLVPLSTQLETGQLVEIITSPNETPKSAWLNFVGTAKARSQIRHYLKGLRYEESTVLGRRMLEQHLAAFSTTLKELPEEQIEAVVTELKLASFAVLLDEIGLGNLLPLLVAQKLVREEPISDTVQQAPLMIAGTEGMVVSFGRCCHPIPGDEIEGFVSVGRGITVHQQNCKNTLKLRDQHDKWLDVAWDANIDRTFPIEIVARVQNQRGVLATIAAAISACNANIDNVTIDERDSTYSNVILAIEVTDRHHLAQIIREMRRLEPVEHIIRQ